MKKIIYSMLFLTVVLALSGCETLKSTISGPFIGLEKDVQNANVALNGTTDADGTKHPGSLQKADAWMKENLW